MLKDNNFKNLILKINFLQSFEGGQTFFDYASPSYSIIEFFIKNRFYFNGLIFKNARKYNLIYSFFIKSMYVTIFINHQWYKA